MANQSGVTINGASGTQVTLTGNSYADTHAAMFSSMIEQIAVQGFNRFQGSSNLLLVGNDAGNVGVFGSSPTGSSVIVVGDGTDLSFVGGSGSTTLVGGNGNDTVVAGSGNDVIAAGTGTDQIYLGSGSSAVSVQGSNDFIQGGTGAASITITGVGATVNGGYGGFAAPMLIDDTQGTSSTLNVVDGTTVKGSVGSTTTVNSYGDITVLGAAGSKVDVNQSGGTMTFVGTGGTISVTGGAAAGGDTLYGGDGSVIVLDSQTHGNVFVANDTAEGGGGDVVMDGRAAGGGNAFWAGSGNETLYGGAGADTLVAGVGATTMSGGSGAGNYFDLFASQSAVDVTISDFGAAAGNKLTFFGFGASAVQAALGAATNGPVQGSVLLQVGNAQVTLLGIEKSTLNGSNVAGTDPAK